MKVSDLLIADMIIPDLKSRERDDVLKELGSFLKGKERISKEKELFERLLQRESLGSTAIGEGVAIPHCKIKSVKEPVVMLAISRQGVDYKSLDGNPSHIFFLVVSSPDNPSLNLQILAAIAHLVRKTDTLIKKILAAKDVNSILRVIREEEERLNE